MHSACTVLMKLQYERPGPDAWPSIAAREGGAPSSFSLAAASHSLHCKHIRHHVSQGNATPLTRNYDKFNLSCLLDVIYM